tara:strand:- start:12564 stop:13139 length:576 start_codon:yes stop_codon:yes gene_type:complete
MNTPIWGGPSYWTRLKIISGLGLTNFLMACSSVPSIPTPVPGVNIPLDGLGGNPLDVAGTTSAYNWIIPLCIGAGIVMLTVTRGKRGWWPLMGAGAVILFNVAMANYAKWIIIPSILGGFGILGFFVWKRLIKVRRKRCLDSSTLTHSSETSGGWSPASWRALFSGNQSSAKSKKCSDSANAVRKDNEDGR